MKGSWVLVVALALGACVPDFAERGDAPVILRVNAVTAGAGGEGEGGAFLLSDVRDTTGSFFNDDVEALVQNIPKNARVPTIDSNMNDVVLESYEVRYVRSDGRSTEGVDVPFRFTGAVNQIVPTGAVAAVSFIIVRHQAKREAPLLNMAGGGGSELLTVTAHFTLYGHTTAGKAVSAPGRIMITFADFAGG